MIINLMGGDNLVSVIICYIFICFIHETHCKLTGRDPEQRDRERVRRNEFYRNHFNGD
jgi:hypothetical protein